MEPSLLVASTLRTISTYSVVIAQGQSATVTLQNKFQGNVIEPLSASPVRDPALDGSGSSATRTCKVAKKFMKFLKDATVGAQPAAGLVMLADPIVASQSEVVLIMDNEDLLASPPPGLEEAMKSWADAVCDRPGQRSDRQIAP